MTTQTGCLFSNRRARIYMQQRLQCMVN